MAGYLLLISSVGQAPNAAALAITSSIVNPTPKFTADGDFVTSDVVQFERQAAGGNWSSATTTTHTVTSNEINGLTIALSLASLSNASYEARIKYHRSGSINWSAYSNVVSFTIAIPTANYTFVASQDADTGSGNVGGNSCDYTITIPSGASDRQLLIGATLQGGTTNFGTCAFDPAGANISVSAPITGTPHASGQSAAFYMLPIGTASGSKVIRINFPSSSFFLRSISVWSVSGLLSTTPKQICNDSTAGASLTDTPVTADAGDLMFVISPSSGAVTYLNSTEPPTREDHVSGTLQNSADWQIQNAYPTSAFHVLSDGNATPKVIVTFQ